MANEDLFKKVISHAKEYGYIFASSEIYDGLSAVYDYAQNGVELKKNIREYWWRSMVYMHQNIVGIDAAILMHPTTWKASGHVDAFNDPLIDNKDSKKRYRADVLIEEYVEKYRTKIAKDVAKGKKRFGDDFNEEEFLKTNPNVKRNQDKIDDINGRFKVALDADDLAGIKTLIEDLGIACPISGSKNWTDVKQFNLMFATEIGSVADSANTIYLRPETAQGIFVNFLNVQKTGRMKIPFGIAQIGKSYRNEISPRRWLIRLREFNQAEIEFFFNPEDQNFKKFENYKNVEIKLVTREDQKTGKEGRLITVGDALEKGVFPSVFMAYFIAKEQLFYESLGIPKYAIRFRHMLPEETPHYSKGNFDLEIKFDFGWKEVVGNAYRGDHDLKAHMNASGEDMSVVINGKKIVPHVVEPSFGIDRTIYAILLYNFVEDEKRGWDWFNFPKQLAPITVGVYPLVNKDGIPEKAKEIYTKIRRNFDSIYDSSGSIGKRYARGDEIGIPFAVTVDYQTLQDGTVTIRDRNTTIQKRVKIEELEKELG